MPPNGLLGGSIVQKLVPRTWLGKANLELEAKHARWAKEGADAVAASEARAQEKRRALFEAMNRSKPKVKPGKSGTNPPGHM